MISDWNPNSCKKVQKMIPEQVRRGRMFLLDDTRGRTYIDARMYDDVDPTPLNELAEALARADDPGLIKSFLESLLTENEVTDISSRWTLVRLIERGMSQRTISRELGLSLCKITRGSRELKKDDSPFCPHDQALPEKYLAFYCASSTFITSGCPGMFASRGSVITIGHTLLSPRDMGGVSGFKSIEALEDAF
jgi:TrpR family trp operon transcriptional repressor